MPRTIVVILWTVFATVFFGIGAIVTALFSRTGNAPHLVARCWARSILVASGVKVSVRGTTYIPTGRPCIFMANHASQFDIPVLLAFLKVQFRWLAKAELFKIPILGRGMQGCGYISIDRSDRKSAFESLKLAAQTIRNGSSVMVFPEGTRSVDGKIHDFKKGGFILALDAGVPVVPIVLHGTDRIMPKGQLRVRAGSVVLEVLPPIDTTPFSRKEKDRLISTIRSAMMQAHTQQRKVLP